MLMYQIRYGVPCGVKVNTRWDLRRRWEKWRVGGRIRGDIHECGVISIDRNGSGSIICQGAQSEFSLGQIHPHVSGEKIRNRSQFLHSGLSSLAYPGETLAFGGE